jgi:hypothetical protein
VAHDAVVRDHGILSFIGAGCRLLGGSRDSRRNEDECSA